MTTTATVAYTRGRIEGDRLTRALLDAAAAGQCPHCSDPPSRHLWLSEHEGERREASHLCGGCPVYEPCGQAATARQEKFGAGLASTGPDDHTASEQHERMSDWLTRIVGVRGIREVEVEQVAHVPIQRSTNATRPGDNGSKTRSLKHETGSRCVRDSGCLRPPHRRGNT